MSQKQFGVGPNASLNYIYNDAFPPSNRSTYLYGIILKSALEFDVAPRFSNLIVRYLMKPKSNLSINSIFCYKLPSSAPLFSNLIVTCPMKPKIQSKHQYFVISFPRRHVFIQIQNHISQGLKSHKS